MLYRWNREKMKDSIKIIETTKLVMEKPVVIIGIPDIGLVGSIATFHILDKLKLEEIAHLESDKFPPVIVVHDKRPKSPIRIYGNKDILILISEIPITSSLIPEISRSLIEWFKTKDVSLVMSLGGIAHPDRLEIKKPTVYGLGTDEETDEILKKNDINIFEEGLIVGPNGIIIRDCMKNGIPSLYLMTESHYRYPDPGAAASIIEIINKILNLNIDVRELLDKEEEIKIKARDLMKRTEQSMKEMQKIREKEIPMMYR
ncbi:MAG TPA: proteasome assembly chaperone family protein [Candidatus Altiarchaeales archaeon]|nr:proteasome assembly chaperone family protein [Candidatus Altiarchaeales archaeon]